LPVPAKSFTFSCLICSLYGYILCSSWLSGGWLCSLDCSGAAPSGKRQSRPTPAESFNDSAYFEARERIRGRCIDGVRPARHWTAVKLEIAKRQGVAIGLAGADMRA
jgi:hypothetical protein